MIDISKSAMTLSITLIAATPVLPSQALQLTATSGGGERQPVVNSEGTVVAYAAMVAGVRELFTVRVDGGKPIRHTKDGRVMLGRGVFESWPSISISDSGNLIAYWSMTGVHILDVKAKTDTVVGTDRLFPYPHVDETVNVVVWQAPVNGAFEVMVNTPNASQAAVQLTSNSGAGSRLPRVRGRYLVYQKPVNGSQELFLYDGSTKLTMQVTKTSGPGNRYARFAADGDSIIYETLVNQAKEVWIMPISTLVPQQLSSGRACGDRLPSMTGDEQVIYESTDSDPDIWRVDGDGKNDTVLAKDLGGGLRRVSADRHGHVLVYQAPRGSSLEVFQLRLCGRPETEIYGTHGKPSTGQLKNFREWYRCDLTLGIETSLPTGTNGLFMFSPRGVLPGIPVPNAPGNFLYQGLDVLLPVSVDPSGKTRITTILTPGTAVDAYYQWALFDRSANRAGIVTSEGVHLRM